MNKIIYRLQALLKSNKPLPVRNEQGMALVTGLVLLLMLAVLAGVSTQWAALDLGRTEKYNKTRDAFYIAEAGIQMALNRLNYDSGGSSPGEEITSGGFDDVLSDFFTNHGSDLTNVSFNSGTYNVTIADNNDNDGDTADDSDNTVVLTSQGTKDGTSVTIEAIIYRPLYKGDNAITTADDLGGGGNVTVNGTNGSIHSNSEVTISGGSATITQGATASGSCSGTGCVAGGVAPQEVPVINPSDYQSSATYILKSNGDIYDQVNNRTYTYTSSGGGNWTWTTTGDGNALFADISHQTGGGGYWRFNGSTMADGMYYAESGSGWDGNVKVLGSPDPWTVTILAEGYIDFGGNADLINYQDSSHTEDIQNLFLVAGTDIEFSGNPSNTIQGLMAAREQMSVSGTVTLQGFVVASDTAADDSKVTANTISGNMTITYNGDMVAPFLSNKVVVLSWQEM